MRRRRRRRADASASEEARQRAEASGEVSCNSQIAIKRGESRIAMEGRGLRGVFWFRA
ncbi:uncharacterized protein J3R85_009973 [Psidium guajava]|nr:uncharacterized protein J3R85_009973 [Psidium guajava]